KAVEDNRPSGGGGGDERADEGGELETYEPPQTLERIGAVGSVRTQSGCDGLPLPFESLGVEPGAAAADGLRRKAGQSCEQRGRNCRVADADLAHEDDVGALGELAGERVARFDRCA